MATTPDSASPVTQRQFFASLTITWLYIFILAGKSMTDNPGPAGIGLFVGALVMYFGQVITLLQMRKKQ